MSSSKKEDSEVFTQAYWRDRVSSAIARGVLHHSVFLVGDDRWEIARSSAIELLREYVKPTDSVLDAGCGYGRILPLLPSEWSGNYVGLDLSDDLLKLARMAFPLRRFVKHDLRLPIPSDIVALGPFDWCVISAMRNMVVSNAGWGVWRTIETNLRSASRRLLIMEYDKESCEIIVV